MCVEYLFKFAMTNIKHFGLETGLRIQADENGKENS
jgi:hypothetical protein